MNTKMTTNPAPLSETEARELTEQITEGLNDVHSLIMQAWEGRAWEALGYESWDAWIDGNFRGLQLRPPREQRDEVVRSMREAGMSMRAISQATELSRGTVQRSAAVSEGSRSDQESSNVVGLDGKAYSTSKRAAASEDSQEATGELTLTDLGVPRIDQSTMRQRTQPEAPAESEYLSGDVVEPDDDSAESESWWEGPRAALAEAEARCVALLQQRKDQPRLVEDPQDPGPSQLTMTAARTVLAAGGVIVDFGVEDLDGESQKALRKVLGTVIESLDGVIGDLEEATNDQA